MPTEFAALVYTGAATSHLFAQTERIKNDTAFEEISRTGVRLTSHICGRLVLAVGLPDAVTIAIHALLRAVWCRKPKGNVRNSLRSGMMVYKSGTARLREGSQC